MPNTPIPLPGIEFRATDRGGQYMAKLNSVAQAIDTAIDQFNIQLASGNDAQLHVQALSQSLAVGANYAAVSQAWAERTENAPVEPGKYSAKHHAAKAATFASTAGSQATTATTQATKAADWAEKAENSLVESGKYSAKHHAAKAAVSATQCWDFRVQAELQASVSATNAQLATDQAAIAISKAVLAQKYAENAENTPVEVGKYSAKHHALKAEYWASLAAASSAGAMAFVGGFNASGNAFPVGAAPGHTYKITTAGTLGPFFDGVTRPVGVGDLIIRRADSSWDWFDSQDSEFKSWVRQQSNIDITPGALLIVEAFGLGGSPVGQETNLDLNNFSNTGWYITATSGVANLPAGWPQGRYYVEVVGRVTSTYCMQRITDMSSAGSSGGNVCRQAVRRMRSTGSWSSWFELWHSNSLVKQSTAIDTTPGAMMSVGAFGLGGNGIQVPNADCNDALMSGIYNIGGTAANAWSGRVSGDMMLVLRFSETAVQQLAITRAGRLFSRGLVNGVWSDWLESWNNLSQLKQTSATDTTETALLSVGAFGLGSYTPGLPVNDLNQLNITGFFRLASDTANIPAGVLVGSTVLNVQYDADDQWQMVFVRDADQIYTRRCKAGVRSSWRQLKMTEDANDAPTLVTAAQGVVRKDKLTRVAAVVSTSFTLNIPSGYAAGDAIEIDAVVASGRVLTLTSTTSMTVTNGTSGTSHTLTGAVSAKILLVHTGSVWQLIIS